MTSKRFIMTLAAALMLTGCEFDDRALRKQLDDQKERLEALEARMAALEKLTGELNAAIDDHLSIVAYTELPDGTGWRITFSDGSSLDVTDGQDGQDGKDGKDGADGKDGTNGRDGTNGNHGNDGDSFIESIEESTDGLFIVITLTNSTVYKFPKAPEPVASGQAGTDLTWTLYPDGTLTISGAGTMPDYNNTDTPPWNDHDADIKKVIIGDGVTHIGDNAFFGCDNLESVTIPDGPNGVTSIGGGAFINCTSLVDIAIPGSVTSIGNAAFYGCNSLESIVIPDGVGVINSNTFGGCTSLASVTIPGSVTSIGDAAFSGCTSLTNVTILATSPPNLGDDNFPHGADTLHVPAECVAAYKGDSAWNAAFNSIMAIPNP